MIIQQKKEKIIILEAEEKFKAYVLINTKSYNNKVFIGKYNSFEEAKKNALQYIN